MHKGTDAFIELDQLVAGTFVLMNGLHHICFAHFGRRVGLLVFANRHKQIILRFIVVLIEPVIVVVAQQGVKAFAKHRVISDNAGHRDMAAQSILLRADRRNMVCADAQSKLCARGTWLEQAHEERKGHKTESLFQMDQQPITTSSSKSEPMDQQAPTTTTSSAKSGVSVAPKRSWAEMNALVQEQAKFLKTQDEEEAEEEEEDDDEDDPDNPQKHEIKDVRPRCLNKDTDEFWMGCLDCVNCKDGMTIEELAEGRNLCAKIKKRREEGNYLLKINTESKPHASCDELIEGLLYLVRQIVAEHGLRDKYPHLPELDAGHPIDIANFLADLAP